MNKELLKFQLSKEAMNKIQGGTMQICHCGGETSTFPVMGDSYFELAKEADPKCKDKGWACTPIKA